MKLPGKSGRKTLADRMGIKGKKKEFDHPDSQSEEYLVDNNDDADTTIKDEEIVYYRARRMVPLKELKVGMARFTFLLENSMPGSVPDPSLLASILDLVIIKKSSQTEKVMPSLYRKLRLSLPGLLSSFTVLTLFMRPTGAKDCSTGEGGREG